MSLLQHIHSYCRIERNSRYQTDYIKNTFGKLLLSVSVRRTWRYQRGNQNPYIEEEQTAQSPKEKVQKDKQRSTKHTYKTKDQ